MKLTIKILSIISFLAFSQKVMAQLDTTKSFNILRQSVPTASSLLGIATSDVATPSDPHNVMISFQNATNNFTTLPKSFAIDVAPFWVFAGKSQTFTQFKKNELCGNIKQSFVISLAYRDSSSVPKNLKGNSQFGLGFKVSLARGNMSKTLEKAISQFYADAKDIDNDLEEIQKNDDKLIKLNKKAKDLQKLIDKETDPAKVVKLKSEKDEVNQKIADRIEEINDEVNIDEKVTNLHKNTIQTVSDSAFIRYGFKFDLAGGWAWNSKSNRSDSTMFYRGGIWTTFGWDMEPNVNKDFMLSWFFMARYLNNPNQAFADDKGVLNGTPMNTFDAGTKLVFTSLSKNVPISFDLEAIYRSITSTQNEKNKIDPSWRLAFNTNYKISKNTALTLAIGRDFDGTVTKSGNVFALLNLVTAFGSKRW